jgi:hypothetical protein
MVSESSSDSSSFSSDSSSELECDEDRLIDDAGEGIEPYMYEPEAVEVAAGTGPDLPRDAEEDEFGHKVLENW